MRARRWVMRTRARRIQLLLAIGKKSLSVKRKSRKRQRAKMAWIRGLSRSLQKGRLRMMWWRWRSGMARMRLRSVAGTIERCDVNR
jgi:hypothetical protein